MQKHNARSLSSQEEAFTKYSVPRVLAKFIVPAALSQLTFLILNLADAFFVGRTNDTFQISSMAITFPVVMLVSCVGTIFGAGANANMAAAPRKGKPGAGKNLFCIFRLYGQCGGHCALLYTFGKEERHFVFNWGGRAFHWLLLVVSALGVSHWLCAFGAVTGVFTAVFGRGGV